MLGMTLIVTLALVWVLVSFLLGGAWAALRYAAQRPDVSDRIPGPRASAHDTGVTPKVHASR